VKTICAYSALKVPGTLSNVFHKPARRVAFSSRVNSEERAVSFGSSSRQVLLLLLLPRKSPVAET
jgi:hypothetical protein